ncbi:DNA damage-inducible protein [Wickerhamomyces ciferrii]|uniref:DNA damage-inducible protein n=1 Tax=Wickerhamomyces ciferrii (strain ATCC 14091 / BCRC 22168 / CBS 111 / JCM 3599 / NBRC 0793 / NRRL Y-1031 F-60-10) TaxID=1206466 RepID=K0KMZ9_WICCF|nr:DNA damage-inducible protein [Wickerhamomyces ciferrii]CCH42503.1 DNA damage-inducible protein [Wickerhamomyces ciferrii]
MSQYGFIKIERDFIKSIPNPQDPTPIKDLSLPKKQDGISSKVLEYVSTRLNKPTLNHSLRVFFYSRAIIKDQFPQWELDEDVLLTTCLLHDLGTTDENMNETKMSFEYYGAFKARDLVSKLTTDNDTDYADAVCEAIIRHQDLNDKGYITQLGLILQISTVLDNAGLEVVSKLIHSETLDLVNKEYSRDGWLGCFAQVVERENQLKPWGHTSSLGVDEFPQLVRSNKLKYNL